MIITGDALERLKTFNDQSIDCCITSPPYYGLRKYDSDGQTGNEDSPQEYITNLVNIFREVKRVLKDTGTFWLNLGDIYNHRTTGGNGATGGLDKSTLASKMPPENTTPTKRANFSNLNPKNLMGLPWRVAFALQDDNWILRQDIIWSKRNPMPESVTDRCTRSHEYIFLLSKHPQYYFDNDAIKEKTITQDAIVRDRQTTKLNNTPGRTKMSGLVSNNYEYRNKRSVWHISSKPYKEAHFATYPVDLIIPMLKAGCPEGGVVLDPFFGSGTTGLAATKTGRKYIGIEINPSYVKLAEKRLAQTNLL